MDLTNNCAVWHSNLQHGSVAMQPSKPLDQLCSPADCILTNFIMLILEESLLMGLGIIICLVDAA